MTKQKMEDLIGKGGGRLKHRTIDGDVPLCLRKIEKESNDDSSSKGKKREEKETLWTKALFQTPQKQTTFISPKGNEKQIDYILTRRRHLKHIKDAEANDMIHMGSDHRCVMAIFTISMLGMNSNHKDIKGKHHTVKRERSSQTAKSISIENARARKIPRNRRNNKKKPPPQQEMKHMTQGRTQKHKSKEKTLQQQKQVAHLSKEKYKRLKEEAWKAASKK